MTFHTHTTNSVICSLAGFMKCTPNKLMRWRDDESRRMDGACEPPVGHYLHHCRCAIKMGLSKSRDSLYSLMLLIHFEEYSLTGACHNIKTFSLRLNKLSSSDDNFKPLEFFSCCNVFSVVQCDQVGLLP